MHVSGDSWGETWDGCAKCRWECRINEWLERVCEWPGMHGKPWIGVRVVETHEHDGTCSDRLLGGEGTQECASSGGCTTQMQLGKGAWMAMRVREWPGQCIYESAYPSYFQSSLLILSLILLEGS